MTYNEISRLLRNLRVYHDESIGIDRDGRETKSVFVHFEDAPKKRSPEGKAFDDLIKHAGFDVADKGVLIKVTA